MSNAAALYLLAAIGVAVAASCGTRTNTPSGTAGARSAGTGGGSGGMGGMGGMGGACSGDGYVCTCACEETVYCPPMNSCTPLDGQVCQTIDGSGGSTTYRAHWLCTKSPHACCRP